MRLVLIVLVFVVFSCCSSKKTEFDSSVIELFPEKPYPQKEIILQDVAEVTYIPLETNERCFIRILDNNRLSVSDSLVVVVSKYESRGDVFIFDWEGKLRHSFDRTGRGPGEHGMIRDFFVDFKAEEIYINSYFEQFKFFVYDYDGNHKRTLECFKKLSVEAIHNYNDDYLLVYMYDRDLDKLRNLGNTKPYYLVSKQDGSLINLDLMIPEWVDNILIKSVYDNGSIDEFTILAGSPIYVRGDEVYVSDYGLDTIYRLQEGNFYPYQVTSFAEERAPNMLLRYMLFKTDRYTVFRRAEKLMEKKRFDTKDILVDHKTGEISEVKFMNKDYVSPKRERFTNFDMELPVNCLVASIPTIKLLDDYEAGKLQGELKELASKMKEDDNPILMVVKFKE